MPCAMFRSDLTALFLSLHEQRGGFMVGFGMGTGMGGKGGNVLSFYYAPSINLPSL